MYEERKAADEEPLSVVADKIARHANRSEQHLISAAMLIREARRRVEAGEAGDVRWCEWAPKNIDLSMSRLRELQSIAAAADPAAEIDRLRQLTQKRVEKHREKKKAAERNSLEEDRELLIAWAKTAPIAEVRRMRDMLAERSSGTPSARSPATPAARIGFMSSIEQRDSRFGLES